MQVDCYFDGSCEPYNPGGYMGLGCVIFYNLEKYTYSKKIDKHPLNTNNIAEYKALEALLNLLIENNLQSKSILVMGDSQIIINQINNDWKVKNSTLKTQYEKCKSLISLFNHIEFKWIPRKDNFIADQLSKTT